MLKNKKIVVIMLSLLLLAQSSIASAVTFTDVNKTDVNAWAYDYIMELAEKGIVEGYPDGSYKPQNFVSFTETLKLLIEIIDPTEAEMTAALNKHIDLIEKVKTPDWAEKTVAYALEKGIVRQVELERFFESDMIKDNTQVFISRYTVALLTARTLELEAKPHGHLRYSDLKDIPQDGLGLLAALIETGVLNIDGRDGAFLPEHNIKRSEMAKMIKYAYDWAQKNPLDNAQPIQTETGVVFDYLTTTRNFLVYTLNNNNVSAVVNTDTAITNKDGNTVKLADLANYKGATAVVSFRMVNDERVATAVKFTTDPVIGSGEYTFESTRTANNKTYVKFEENANEFEIKSNVVKNGNSNLLLEDIKEDSKLVVKIENGIVTEMSLKTAQTGQYRVENRTAQSITVSPVNGGTLRTYTVHPDALIYNGATKSSLSGIQIGDLVDLSFVYSDVANRIIIYPVEQRNLSTHTFNEILYNNILIVTNNRTSEIERYAINNTVFRNEAKDRLVRGDKLQLTFNDAKELITVTLVSSESPFRDGISTKFELTTGLGYLFTNKEKTPVRLVQSNSQNIEIYINGVKSNLNDLPISGTALVVYDGNNIVRINYTK